MTKSLPRTISHMFVINKWTRVTERLSRDGQRAVIHFPGPCFMCWRPACLGAKETAEEMPALAWEMGGHLTPSLRWVGLNQSLPSRLRQEQRTHTLDVHAAYWDSNDRRGAWSNSFVIRIWATDVVLMIRNSRLNTTFKSLQRIWIKNILTCEKRCLEPLHWQWIGDFSWIMDTIQGSGQISWERRPRRVQ